MNWPSVKLGEVFDIARGGSPRPIDDFISDAPDAMPWISIRDASDSSKFITKTRLKIRREGISRSRIVNAGDFLLTNSMSFGRPYICGMTGCIHDGWLVLAPRDRRRVDQDFFYQLLGSGLVYRQFAKLAAGAVVKNLNIDLVEGVTIPLPPLSEQRRIADILDRADAVRRKRREAIALTEELLRSAFVEMFGDPVTNPKGWPERRIGDFTDVATGGTPSRNEPANFGGGIPWVKTTEVRDAEILETEETVSEQGVADSNCRLFPVASIVVAMYGQGATRGRTGVLGIPATTNQACAVIIPSAQYTTDFLWLVLQLSYERLRGLGRGGNQPNLNLGMIRDFLVPLPPIPEQRTFEAFVKRARRVGSIQGAHDSEAEILFLSLVQRAFRGEIGHS